MHTSLPSPTPHPFPALPPSFPPPFPFFSRFLPADTWAALFANHLDACACRERRRRDDTRTARCFTYWSSFFVPPIALLPNSQCPPGFCMDPASVRTGESAGGRGGGGCLISRAESGLLFVLAAAPSFPRSKSYMTERHTLWHVLCA